MGETSRMQGSKKALVMSEIYTECSLLVKKVRPVMAYRFVVREVIG